MINQLNYNIMKLKLITIIITCFVGLSYAQKTRSTFSIYEYGDKLTSCETNFQNLFKFWIPKYITNANETKLITYQFVEELKDTKQITKYIDLLTSTDNLIGSTKMSNGVVYDKKNQKRKYGYYYRYIETFEQLNSRARLEKEPELKKEVFINTQEQIAKGLRRDLRIGDQIYVIKIQKGNKLYDNYVVCDPKTFKVKFDNLFWGIQLWK